MRRFQISQARKAGIDYRIGPDQEPILERENTFLNQTKKGILLQPAFYCGLVKLSLEKFSCTPIYIRIFGLKAIRAIVNRAAA